MTSNHWPFRVVWARQRGWIEVEDPETGEWFEIPAQGAPRGWVKIAVEAAVPKRTLSTVRINETYEPEGQGEPNQTLRGVRNDEKYAPDLRSRRLW